jgi:hypothetical protein
MNTETTVNGSQAQGIKRLPVAPKANPQIDCQLKNDRARDPKQKMQGGHDRTLGRASNLTSRKFLGPGSR